VCTWKLDSVSCSGFLVERRNGRGAHRNHVSCTNSCSTPPLSPGYNAIESRELLFNYTENFQVRLNRVEGREKEGKKQASVGSYFGEEQRQQ
jgi:hypothetical protein